MIEKGQTDGRTGQTTGQRAHKGGKNIPMTISYSHTPYASVKIFVDKKFRPWILN